MMKTGRTVFLALLVAIMLWLANVPFMVAGQTFSFNFNLIGPNTAMDPIAHETIEMTGSGSFNPAGPIVASGSFAISNSATGVVVARGTWSATAFNMFVGFGGPNPGTQGGHLLMTVTQFFDDGATLKGQPMTVTCRVFAPSPPATLPEGVTIGSFTNITRGLTLFHLND
jgi:hypothetical protein